MIGSVRNKTRWFFILMYFVVTLLGAILPVFFDSSWLRDIIPVVTVFSIFIAAFLHGVERYGLKNMVVFFAITWAVSHFFEALSIQIGFPFGHYYYDKLIGPRLFNVPLVIMFAYFGTGYASWILSHLILEQYEQLLQGLRLFLIPFVASFIMVMWDVCMDPLCSTVASLWVWKDGGSYFGVPLQNYFGWFLVVFIIYQCFALYISKQELKKSAKKAIFTSKTFWLEAVAIYFIQGLTQLIQPLNGGSNAAIYNSMALITVFTMIFAALIASLTVLKAKL